MGLDVVIFIIAIVLGVFIYWRESQSNALYRFLNKMFNTKTLQMKASDKKGFVYKRAFLPRLVYVTGILVIIGLAVQFLSPFAIFTSYYGVSAFASTVAGVMLGTYLAHFILKSGEVIEEKSDVIEDLVQDTLEKGKDFIEDLKTETPTLKEDNKTAKNEAIQDGKSARERLKDKGLL